MLDLFAIFSKSGIVLFAAVNSSIQCFQSHLNRIIKNVILEDRLNKFQIDTLLLQFYLDNEFELVFVVGYQKMLSLSYTDKFLTDVQLAFREKYKNYDLNSLHWLFNKPSKTGESSLEVSEQKKSTNNDQAESKFLDQSICPLQTNPIDFNKEFRSIYAACNRLHLQQSSKNNLPEMRTFEQSQKSKKTVSSMIIQSKNPNLNPNQSSKKTKTQQANPKNGVVEEQIKTISNGPLNNEEILKKLIAKRSSTASPKQKKVNKTEPKKKTKQPTVWDFGGKTDSNLDFSKKDENDGQLESSIVRNMVDSQMIPKDLDVQTNLDFDVSDDDDTEEEAETVEDIKTKGKFTQQTRKSGFFGSIMNTLSYNKTLSAADLDPILANLRDHLIAKNVAAEIAYKLCDSVSSKLIGQNVNTWIGLKSFVKNSLEESILRILSPNRNINILREVQIKNQSGRPYVIVFCGVNGVGKSTNLAKIANWLLLNEKKILVIACDTFRAGAIEQLRTHIKALKNIHQAEGKDNRIELYEKGYGKDSTGIAMEGIRFAANAGFDVCLVDTAGRMQGNEPLMKQLAKLIKVNEPDLTLFVGEALVGNEAVDQLLNFNRSLLDNGCRCAQNDSVSAINGIVLTKFDTIDDQVGAAISMTYITGQPILFVGVGQTYKDLKQLNAKAVVRALMK
ncbi:ABC transporter [Sarcoptes scabiei]|nr:ABC transporter [Sarcoptes scabiei]